MKRMVSLIAVVLVLFTGVALAQQPPPSPKPESGHHRDAGRHVPDDGRRWNDGRGRNDGDDGIRQLEAAALRGAERKRGRSP